MRHPYGKEHKYPERQRCYTCRRFFGFLHPILGLYCSFACAAAKNHEPREERPARPDPAIVPRCCRVKKGYGSGPMRTWQWEWKHRYKSPTAARATLHPRERRLWEVYRCDHCNLWHRAKKVRKHEPGWLAAQADGEKVNTP